MHGSLLPKYRGRAPVHWAILRGETVTGASLHYMLEKPDAGALVDQQSVPIAENDTALDVSLKVAGRGAAVLHRSLPALIAGTAPAAAARSVAGLVFRPPPPRGRPHRLARRRARAVHDLVRAVAPPFPGAFTEVGGVAPRGARNAPRRRGRRGIPAAAPCLYGDERRLVRRLRRRPALEDHPSSRRGRRRPMLRRGAAARAPVEQPARA